MQVSIPFTTSAFIADKLGENMFLRIGEFPGIQKYSKFSNNSIILFTTKFLNEYKPKRNPKRKHVIDVPINSKKRR